MSDEMPDLGALLNQAQEMMAAQSQLAGQLVTGNAGGGVVQVDVTGGGEFEAVRIAPSAVDPADLSMLEDLVLAALRDAAAQIAALHGGAMGGLDIDISSLLGGGE